MNAHEPSFAPSARLSLQLAQGIAQARGDGRIGGTHLLLALASLEGAGLQRVLAGRGLTLGVLRTLLEEVEGPPGPRQPAQPEPAPELRAVVERARRMAGEEGRTAIERHHLEAALLSADGADGEDAVLRFMDAAGMVPADLLRELSAASEG